MNNRLLQMASDLKNPKNAVLNKMKNCNNPIFSQLVQYAENGENDKIEIFAKNYAKEHNIDYEKEINTVKSILNMFNRR